MYLKDVRFTISLADDRDPNCEKLHGASNAWSTS